MTFLQERGAATLLFRNADANGRATAKKTAVRYDIAGKRLSIDRGQSGIIISNQFAQTDGQTVESNADGSIDLHIYVDRSSVEAFAKGYTVAGGNQIFQSLSSLGAAVIAEGGSATADCRPPLGGDVAVRRQRGVKSCFTAQVEKIQSVGNRRRAV